MTGYVRQRDANIVNGGVGNASDVKAEFDQVQLAFNATTGHKHDGSTGEGVPITVTGAGQDYIFDPLFIKPKITATYDLGSSSFRFKDGHFSGTVSVAALTASGAISAASGTIGGVAITTATNTQTLTGKTIDLGSNTVTMTSAQLATALTDETGTGANVFAGSPALTGTPTAPTAAAATNTTQIATTAHVFAERSNTATLTNKTLTSPSFSFSNPATAQASLGIPPDDNGNRIMNGDFIVWQRATSGTANGYTAADRWLNGASGGTVTQSRSLFNPGDGVGISSITPTFALSQNVTGQSLSSHYAVTQQRIENVRNYSGQTITVLGYVIRAAGSGNAVIEMSQNFGTGGSPSAAVTGISPTTITPTGVWQPFAAVMTVPSISGKVLGSNFNDYLELNLWASAGSTLNSRTNSLGLQTQNILWHGVHIRVGTWAATDAALYRPRNVGVELALCQRYYWSGLLRSRFRAAVSSEFNVSNISFPTEMRGAPAASFISNSYTTNVVAVTISQLTSSGCAFEITSLSTGDTFRGDFYGFDAEL
jgi:hypothetical protein